MSEAGSMFTLQFDEAICASCPSGACLVKCQYLEADREQAKREMLKIFRGEDSRVLQECVTCYACEEYCKRGNHPFYLITQRREEKGILTAPRAITRQWINIGEPRGKYEVGEIKERALSFGFMPQFKDIVKGKLFEDVMPGYFFGQEYFCNVVYIHFANTAVIKERLPQVIRNIQELGVKEVVFMHDECYAAFSSLAPAFGMEVPFKPIHYFEYLYQRLEGLRGDIRPLHIRVAYQRPCSNRLCPRTHRWVPKILDLIGAELVTRTYQDENALCCGSIFRAMYGYDLAADVQARNIEDIVKSGAEYCVFNCHGCQNALSDRLARKGVRPIHMVELCRMAIGENPGFEVP
ncbi:MAG: (Fe-S)-binding protein [Deltaproteobacteria bacterium]|nr:(Fe-S)-binding protein [Deltaproteobacteria bacterium]